MGIHAIIAEKIAQLGGLEFLHGGPGLHEECLGLAGIWALRRLQKEQIEQGAVDRSDLTLKGRVPQVCPPPRPVAEQLHQGHRTLVGRNGPGAVAGSRQESTPLGMPTVEQFGGVQVAGKRQGASRQGASRVDAARVFL